MEICRTHTISPVYFLLTCRSAAHIHERCAVKVCQSIMLNAEQKPNKLVAISQHDAELFFLVTFKCAYQIGKADALSRSATYGERRSRIWLRACTILTQTQEETQRLASLMTMTERERQACQSLPPPYCVQLYDFSRLGSNQASQHSENI